MPEPSFDAERVRRKLTILADAAKYDASCASSGVARSGKPGTIGSADPSGICHSYTPDGRCVSLLRILLTNACVYDCVFCVNRVSNDIPRARFSPREVAELTMAFYRRNYIEGLFLSSGVVKGPDHTAEEMLEVGRLLRDVHKFGGYVHFKVVPGTSAELVARLGRYADRLSANIELPTEADLARLAPEKTMAQAEGTMQVIARGIEEHRAQQGQGPSFAAGQSTQLVVGATASTDADVLGTAQSLYRRYRLKRVYYTAFSPIPGADPRLPATAPPLLREHRLYQADWLLRHYGFRSDELVSAAAPNLSLDFDPKHAWALSHRELFPMDVNTAAREQLLRVPGLGVRAVERILSARRHRRLTLADVKRLGAVLGRAQPFLLTADRNPAAFSLDGLRLPERRPPRAGIGTGEQLSLFATAASAHGGEL